MVFEFAYNEEKEYITLKVVEIYDENVLDIFDINSSDLIETPLFNAEGNYFIVENTEIIFYRSENAAKNKYSTSFYQLFD